MNKFDGLVLKIKEQYDRLIEEGYEDNLKTIDEAIDRVFLKEWGAAVSDASSIDLLQFKRALRDVCRLNSQQIDKIVYMTNNSLSKSELETDLINSINIDRELPSRLDVPKVIELATEFDLI